MIIYLTTNKINRKKYIGKDRNNLPWYIGGGVLLKKDIKKYGKENFIKEIIEYCETIEELKQKETYWLKYYDAANNDGFYNLTNKSNGSDNGPTKTKLYLERGKKISESKKGKPNPHVTQLRKGTPLSDETKQKMRKPKPKGFGENLSKERKGKPSPLKNKPHVSNYKVVLCLNENKQLIKEYPSQKHAEQELGLSKGTISKGIKLGYKIGGYYWIFKL